MDARKQVFSGLLMVRQAWRVARKRERIGYGGHFVDLAVQVRCRP